MRVSTSADKAVTITPSDTIDIAGGAVERIYVGGAGVVAVVLTDGVVVNITAVAGGYLDVRAKRVNNTNTTATLMVGLR